MATGIQISPGLTNIEPGESYTLTLKNLTGKKIELELSPVLLSVNSGDNKLVLASEATEKNITSLGEFLEVSNSKLVLDAGDSDVIAISFKKEFEGFYLGTAVRQSGRDGNQVGVAGQLISSIVPTRLSDSQISQLGNGIEALPSMRIAGINIGNVFDISSQIENSSDRAIRPSAEVTMFFGEKRIENTSLTSKLPNQLLPKATTQVDSRVIDNRPFWKRLGYHSFQQTLQVDGRSLVTTQEVLSVPIEFIGIFVLLMGLVSASAYTALRRFRGQKFVAEKKTAKIQR